MEITKKDQKKLLKKYGYMNEHHFEGDKTLEERVNEIDEEYENLLKSAPAFGPKYVDWFSKNLGDCYSKMKEDIKKLYK